ncbi:MAG TPA: M20/M25/M40 family metallo-hydrolase [Solirubrobacteraceae bacterium]|nr:M20/M25/M40 family metallo-hydrolase [Solirubrobacteraceae bacterium]
MIDARDEALAEEAGGLLRRLIACDTSNPPGNETHALALLEEYLVDAGLECERVYKDPDRANLVATLYGVGHGPSLGFLGHVDVVPADRTRWSVDPFAGIERDGVIWGRGAVDMKCQVAATCVALASLARQGFTPQGDLMLLLMSDEEVGEEEVGTPYFVEARPELCPDFIVGEGAGERYDTTVGPIYLLDHGVKSTASATLTAPGRAGDASLPGGGPNALLELTRLLERLAAYEAPVRIPAEVEALIDTLAPGDAPHVERLEQARATHPAFERLLRGLVRDVIHPTIAESPGPKNIIPEQATATLSCTVLPDTSAKDLERELREALGEGDYDLEVVEPKGGSTSELDTPLHAAIADSLAEHDPDARLVPALGYGFSDCHVFRESYGSVAYGFIPLSARRRDAEPGDQARTRRTHPRSRPSLSNKGCESDCPADRRASPLPRHHGQRPSVQDHSLTTLSFCSVGSLAPSTNPPASTNAWR